MASKNRILIRIPKIKITEELIFRVLLAVIWSYYTIGNFVVQIFRAVPFVGQFYQSFLPICVVFLTLLSFRYIAKRLRPTDILFYIGCVLVVLLTLFFAPKNEKYILEHLYPILFTVFPMYFIGVVLPYEVVKKDLFWVSLLGVFATFAYQFFLLSSGRVLLTDSMSTSYKVLPSIMYLIHWALIYKKVSHWIFASIGIILSFLFGTRGPILVIVSYILLQIYFDVIRQKSFWKRFIFLISVTVVIVFLSFGDNLLRFATVLSEKFAEMGFSSRIFDYLIAGEFSQSNSRLILSQVVMDAIMEKPIIGYGIMGDRVVTGGKYVHNIAMELWCNFGLLFGSTLLAIVLILPVCALWKNRGSQKFNFILMYTCLVIIELFLSNSYIIESNFFFLVGILVSAIRTKDVYRNEKIVKKVLADV